MSYRGDVGGCKVRFKLSLLEASPCWKLASVHILEAVKHCQRLNKMQRGVKEESCGRTFESLGLEECGPDGRSHMTCGNQLRSV